MCAKDGSFDLALALSDHDKVEVKACSPCAGCVVNIVYMLHKERAGNVPVRCANSEPHMHEY